MWRTACPRPLPQTTCTLPFQNPGGGHGLPAGGPPEVGALGGRSCSGISVNTSKKLFGCIGGTSNDRVGATSGMNAP